MRVKWGGMRQRWPLFSHLIPLSLFLRSTVLLEPFFSSNHQSIFELHPITMCSLAASQPLTHDATPVVDELKVKLNGYPSDLQTLKAPLPNPSLQVTADHNLKRVDAPVYAPKSGEVLLHIKATGICGWDKELSVARDIDRWLFGQFWCSFLENRMYRFPCIWGWLYHWTWGRWCCDSCWWGCYRSQTW